MKKAVLVSCFNYYDNRLRLIENYLKERDYKVVYITSDFDHILKKRFNMSKVDCIKIHTVAYKRNLSIKRLYSHVCFSKQVYKNLCNIKPDLVYAIIPPNTLTKYVMKYKNKNNCRVYVDIYDIWPESFPSEAMKRVLAFPLKIWRDLRDKNLSKADKVIVECNLYRKIIKKAVSPEKIHTLYLAKESLDEEPRYNDNTLSVNLCYLGSINTAIDIKTIGCLLHEITLIKPVNLHIIGDGEQREKLIQVCEDAGATVIYYGKIFDISEKKKVFDKCSFGINIYAENQVVGLTMKSVDYFQSGLPILNTIKKDTTEIVNANLIGLNITNDNMQEIAQKICNIHPSELLEMKNRTKALFESEFSYLAFLERLGSIFRY